MVQATNEGVMAFHDRLTSAARKIGSPFDTETLMTIFYRGLSASLVDMAGTLRDKHTGPNALRKFAQEVAAYQKTLAAVARTARGQGFRENRTTVAFADASTGSRNITRGANRSMQGDVVALADAADGVFNSTSSSPSTVSPPTDRPTARPASDPDSILLSSVAASRLYGQNPSISTPMVTARASSDARRNNRHTTPGNAYPPFVMFGGQPVPLICYLCFVPGHFMRDCPHIAKARANPSDPQLLRLTQSNWEALPQWQKELLRAQGRGCPSQTAQRGDAARGPVPPGRGRDPTRIVPPAETNARPAAQPLVAEVEPPTPLGPGEATASAQGN